MNTGFIFTLIASFTVLFIGVITVLHDKRSVTNKLFVYVSLSTIFWSLANYFSLEPIIFPSIVWVRLVLFCAVPHIVFFYFFVRNFPHTEMRLPKLELFVIISLAIPVMILTLTNLVFKDTTHTGYDVIPVAGKLIAVFGIFVIFVLMASIVHLIIKYREAGKDEKKSWKAMLFGFSISYFSIILTNFVLVNVYGDTRYIVYAPLFMLPTVIGTAYSILRYKLLNVKAIATEVIVFILLSVVLVQIALSQTAGQFVFNSILFCVFLILSIFLVKSVLLEVEQKEYLQALNLELQRLIKQRESLVHLITHKVKGSFTRSKYLFAEMLEGTFGTLTPELNMMVKKGLESDIEGIATVDLVLNSANLQNGNVKYEMKMIDFKDIVEKLVVEKRVSAQGRGQEMTLEVQEGDYAVLGDTFWLKEVVINLLENSIRYTKVGKIAVSLSKNDGKILFSVKDTGIGISDEDKKNLFTEGGRGKDSVKMNVDSTGYGLFSVKLIVEAHKGRIWAESEGAGKGSQFFVELPVGEK